MEYNFYKMRISADKALIIAIRRYAKTFAPRKSTYVTITKHNTDKLRQIAVLF